MKSFSSLPPQQSSRDSRSGGFSKRPFTKPVPSSDSSPSGRAVGAISGSAGGVHPALLCPSIGGRALPPPIQAKMEAALGHDFSDVRVHQGPEAASIGALAFTRGSHLHFAPGQYRPHSAKGQRILVHELTHVIQQRAGRVRSPGGTVPINRDSRLEGEADAVADRAAKPAPSADTPIQRTAAKGEGPIQCEDDELPSRFSFLRGAQRGFFNFPQRQQVGATRTAEMMFLRGREPWERVNHENWQLLHAGGVLGKGLLQGQFPPHLVEAYRAIPPPLRQQIPEAAGELAGQGVGGFAASTLARYASRGLLQSILSLSPRHRGIAPRLADQGSRLVGHAMKLFTVQGMANSIIENKQKLLKEPLARPFVHSLFGPERSEFE